MAAPGQRIRRQGSDWIELEYTHDGVVWRQGHRIVNFVSDHAFVVSGQAPEGGFSVADMSAKEVAHSLCPYIPG